MTTRGIALFAGLLLATLPGSAWPATGLVRADDGATIDAARVAAAIGVEPSDLQLLALPDATAGWHSAGVSLEACAGQPSTPLGLVVDAASAQLRDLRSDEAQEALSSSIEGLPCVGAFAERTTLVTALELLGQAAQDEGDTAAARAAYEQLLAVDQGFSLTSAPGTGYEVLFDDVRRAALSAGTIEASVQHADWTVAVDGVAVPARSAGTLRLAPGRHLLQWQVQDELVGAWLTLEAGAPRVALLAHGYLDILGQGPIDAGKSVAIEAWLGHVATSADLDGVAVVQAAEPLAGYVVRGGSAEAWAAAPEAAVADDPKVARPGGVGFRLAVGGGWMLASLASYGDIAAAADVHLVGPLHLRIDGDLGISQPISMPGGELDGVSVLLPGVGVGVSLRRPGGPVQPYGAISVGLWITPDTYTDPVLADAQGIGAVTTDLEARGPVTFRGFADGGVDLHPGDSPLLVRLYGGIGYGFGFQVHAGAQVGFRAGGR